MAKALKIALWNEIHKKRPAFLMKVVFVTYYTSENVSVNKTLEDHLQNIRPAIHSLPLVISGCCEMLTHELSMHTFGPDTEVMQAIATTLYTMLPNDLLYTCEKSMGINLETKSYQNFRMSQILNSASSLTTFQMTVLYLVSCS